jgi:type III restriction enzyme
LSINSAQIAGIIDRYIRERLFDQAIDPNNEEIWKVLRIKNVIDHIVAQVSGLIVTAHEQSSVDNSSEVRFTALSSVNRITVRENYCEPITKCIYEELPFPSNKGGLEHDFMLYADNDGAVDAICKIIEQRHTFVRFRYVREDGLPAEYIPDFFVRFGTDVYIVETKAQDQVSHANVIRKQKAALRWVERTNNLPREKRENSTWHYVILSDSTFYDWRNKRMELREILNFAELRNDETGYSGRLF